MHLELCYDFYVLSYGEEKQEGTSKEVDNLDKGIFPVPTAEGSVRSGFRSPVLVTCINNTREFVRQATEQGCRQRSQNSSVSLLQLKM